MSNDDIRIRRHVFYGVMFYFNCQPRFFQAFTVGTLVSFAITSLILKMEKTVETESEDEFAQSANAVKAMKQEGAFSLSRVKRIAFVCDAGMGSSAMGATTFRKRLEKAGLAMLNKVNGGR